MQPKIIQIDHFESSDEEGFLEEVGFEDILGEQGCDKRPWGESHSRDGGVRAKTQGQAKAGCISHLANRAGCWTGHWERQVRGREAQRALQGPIMEALGPSSVCCQGEKNQLF